MVTRMFICLTNHSRSVRRRTFVSSDPPGLGGALPQVFASLNRHEQFWISASGTAVPLATDLSPPGVCLGYPARPGNYSRKFDCVSPVHCPLKIHILFLFCSEDPGSISCKYGLCKSVMGRDAMGGRKLTLAASSSLCCSSWSQSGAPTGGIFAIDSSRGDISWLKNRSQSAGRQLRREHLTSYRMHMRWHRKQCVECKCRSR